MTQGEQGEYIVSLPADYDENRAYPVGFGFHGYNRTHHHCQEGDCLGFQSAMQDHAILIYMKSFTAGWEQPAVVDQNADFFVDVLDHIEANYCADRNRVFVAGTSSGAAFSNILACRYGDRLLATVPVAGSMPEKDCVGDVAALVIHGIADLGNDIAGGRNARDYFLAANDCGPSSVPPVDEVDARVLADREAMIEGHECSDYVECPDRQPVRWCVHSEGGYENLNHGWPTFGGDEIWAFVESL